MAIIAAPHSMICVDVHRPATKAVRSTDLQRGLQAGGIMMMTVARIRLVFSVGAPEETDRRPASLRPPWPRVVPDAAAAHGKHCSGRKRKHTKRDLGRRKNRVSGDGKRRLPQREAGSRVARRAQRGHVSKPVAIRPSQYASRLCMGRGRAIMRPP